MNSTKSHNHRLNRRQMLLAGLAAAAPVWGGKRIDRSRFSAITDEIAKTPAAAIEFAQKYGLQWLELRAVPGARTEYFQLPETALQQAAKEFREGGVKISFLNTSMLKYVLPGTESPAPGRRWDSSRFEKRDEELQRAIAAAQILGVDKVRIFTFMRCLDREKHMPRVAEVINQYAEVAARNKIHLLIENEGACNVGTAAELAELMPALPSKWIGINWDPLNAANKKEIAFPDGYKMLPFKRIGNVQVKGKSILPGPELMDWTAIFRQLEKDNYTGKVGLETHIFGEIQVQKSHESIQEMIRLVS